MGWDTSARTIKGITYGTGTAFTLNGNIPCYGSCDSTTVKYWKNSVTAWYYGYFSESYSRHPYCMSTTRPGKPDLFVDASAFPPATYYVYYNLNNGSGSFPTQAKVYGGSVNLHGHIPTRAGHTFIGWSTSSAATTASYGAGAAYSGNASMTLYAVWSVNSYTITYDANEGASAPNAQSFKYNGGNKISTAKPTRAGYTFVNWKASHGEYYFNPGDAIPEGWGNFTLVAQWAINTYHFSVYANGGELVSGSDVFNAIANYGVVVDVPAVARTGYTFAGWAVTGKGTLTQVGSAYTYTMDVSDVILTAQWTVNEYTVTLDANTNGGSPSKIIGYNYGDYVNTNEEVFYTPNKPYCEFVGWYTVPEDTEDKPVNLHTLVVEGNITLYAHFEEKNTMLVSAEGANRPAMAAVYIDDKFIEECEVMIYVDGAWRKAVVQT